MKKNRWIIALSALVVIAAIGYFLLRPFWTPASKNQASQSSTGNQNSAAQNPNPRNSGESNTDKGRPKAPLAGVVSPTLKADAHRHQTFDLWQKNNVPTQTDYKAAGGNDDGANFRPNMISFPVARGTKIKGAVLICAGGAFQFRSNVNEGYPVAEELAKRGYVSFVVNYRVLPYTQQEGALDLARGVRYVSSQSDVYGFPKKNIAVMGFSAGGILAGEMLLNYDGTVTGQTLDKRYQPDSLDRIPIDVAADGMIYSFYGQLSIASRNVNELRRGQLPPTYFCYGTEDPFVDEFQANIRALRQAGVPVQSRVLQGIPHGYGYRHGWIPAYDQWLTQTFNATK
ncbi:MAG: alpha/beta hydrolase [Oenococcus sp.]|uniref:alpha/beta hydrolase n=1 Tax=Oenococcus sp. TaxID=1979414 RepID=UPI0039E8D615